MMIMEENFKHLPPPQTKRCIIPLLPLPEHILRRTPKRKQEEHEGPQELAEGVLVPVADAGPEVGRGVVVVLDVLDGVRRVAWFLYGSHDGGCAVC